MHLPGVAHAETGKRRPPRAGRSISAHDRRSVFLTLAEVLLTLLLLTAHHYLLLPTTTYHYLPLPTTTTRCSVFLTLAEVQISLNKKQDAASVMQRAIFEFSGGAEEGRVTVTSAKVEAKRGKIPLAPCH